jgi:hypothetical protein
VSTPRPQPAPKAVSLHTVPEQLVESTRWSDVGEAVSAHSVISRLKGMPRLLRLLETAATVAASRDRGHLPEVVRPPAHGPARMQGNWVLAYIAFVMSGRCDIQPWHRAHACDTHLWQLCGFLDIPKYQTVWQAFTELECVAEVFNTAAAVLMRHVSSQDARVGAWWHIDASESQTNAVPNHDCRPGDPCPADTRPRAAWVTSYEAAQLRRQEAELATEAEESGTIAPENTSFQGTTTTRIGTKQLDDLHRGVRYLASDGHFYLVRDCDSGARAYTGEKGTKRYWDGYYAQTIADHFTHLPLAIHIFPADQSEASEYPVAFALAENNISATPKLVAADRGYAFAANYEHNTRRGVGSVFQYRRRAHETRKVAPSAGFDEDGIPACKHCGESTDLVRFRIDGPKRNRPRVWFRCLADTEPGCAKEQVISCSRDWRRLLPVWRTHAAYLAMAQSHHSYEGKHQAMRSNYLIAPNAYAIRSKRIGMAWQQLRANAALLVEWLRFHLQGGVAALGVTATKRSKVEGRIADRRAEQGLAGGGIVGAAEAPSPTTESPPD